MGFEENYGKLRVTEGAVWTNNEGDRGGETYVGISRVRHPNWEGWDRIDASKKDKKFPNNLAVDSELQLMVEAFYKKEFWDIFRGDEMPEALGAEMFDTGVNQGIGTAVKYLQQALNVLNRNGTLFQDLKDDGVYGSMTKTCLDLYLAHDSLELLLKIMNVLQGATYINIMKQDPTQEKWCRGWFKRVEITKS